MAVPTRPVAGAPIASDWGGVAHDTAVAQDLQAGQAVVNFAASAQASVVVTFPRPFASPPTVVVTFVGNNSGASLAYYAQVIESPSAAGCTIRAQHNNGTAATAGPFFVTWMAYGPRA